jgi:RND family efflux transporter MFP subunit
VSVAARDTISSMRALGLVAIVAVAAAGALAGVLSRTQKSPPPPEPAARVEAAASAPNDDDGDEKAPRELLGVVLTGQDVDVAPKTEGRVLTVAVKAGERVKRNQVVAQMDVKATRQALHLAEVSLRDADARLSRRTAMAEGVLSQEEISNAQALVLERRGRVEELRAQINDAAVRAPFAGVVSTRFVDAGAMAGPARPIVRLVGGNDLRVRFAIPEEQTGSVAAGMHARVRVKSVDEPLVAVVENVSPEIDAAARMTFAVARVELPPRSDLHLVAGMTARLELERAAERR